MKNSTAVSKSSATTRNARYARTTSITSMPSGVFQFGTSPGAAGTLSERVYQALKRDLIRGVYSAGEALSEKALTKRYRGSRTPVREAAVRLQQEGLLRIVPNRGYFASPVTISWLNQIYEYRAAVESAGAELAARKGNDEGLLQQLAKVVRTVYDFGDRASYERFIEEDTAFHIGIARLTRNPLLVQTVQEMRCQMERVMYAAIDIGYFGEAPIREHSEILEAIRQHDPDRARQLMYDHIIGSRGKVLGLANNSENPIP
jgi:DNA-binding GntR family transcriptional regulator